MDQLSTIASTFTGKWHTDQSIYDGRAPVAWRAAKQGAPYSKETIWIAFLVVIMVSVIARRRIHKTTTTTAKSSNMVAILQLKGWPRHATLVYSVYLWYCNWTSMLWSIDACQNTYKHQVPVSDWIAGSSQVTYCNLELRF